MANYKVIQDIEAEDKLLGPLTLKQFIYAIIVVVSGFIAFKLGTVAWYLALPFLPVMLVFGILAAPLGRDQPTEIWVLAKLRYWFKPRLRTWDQTGQVNLVTITVPKIIDPSTYTDNLSQTEVKSRLKALGETLDTRGWAVKNVKSDAYTANPTVASSSDRLLQLTTTSSEELPSVAIRPDDDILDEENNPVAKQLGEMISSSTQSHRRAMVEKMQAIRTRMAKVGQTRTEVSEPETGNWFMGSGPSDQSQPSGFATFTSQSFSASTPGSSKLTATADDRAVINKALGQKTKKDRATERMRKLRPQAASTPSPAMTAPSDTGILELAHNDDLSVATIARQAQGDKQPPNGEVSISLH